MKHSSSESLIEKIKSQSSQLKGRSDLRPLIDLVKDKKIVMLGESTHGTHEFYELRRLITEWLVEEHGFNFVAVEGDWPPCWRLNDFVNTGAGRSAREVLLTFNRWPTWMWSNTEVVRLANGMHSHNDKVDRKKRVGFYGLDVYSFFESMDIVIRQLSEVSSTLAKKVKQRYECLERFDRDEKTYARSLHYFPEGCERQVLETLEDVLKLRLETQARLDKDTMPTALIDAEQNARIVANAERYYRAMMFENEDSWNVRDQHMLDTLETLLERYGKDSKAIVWAHNTHIGDYRATEMLQRGQVNIGGLAREKWGADRVSLVGFSTHRGQVVASYSWDGPTIAMTVPPAKDESYEDLFHRACVDKKQKSLLLTFDHSSNDFVETRGHRAIGVVYYPAHEGRGNYVPTSLSNRYDAFIFVDETTALEPLAQKFESRDIPQTWPAGE